MSTRPARSSCERAGTSPLAVALLLLAQNDDDDDRALQGMGNHIRDAIGAARVDFQAETAGAVTPLVTAGGGATPALGGRALEAGNRVGPEEHEGISEAALPVRLAGRLLGALACRWPPGRTPPEAVESDLAVAAAIAAPRLDALLASRADTACQTTAIPELVGESRGIVDVRRAVTRAAASPFAVLIEGESGTGTELVARAIHALSARRDRGFCDVNCAALPDELVESELFGHARGAFTGALVERRGLFEDAHGGTLFLDELPDLSLRAQAKLLRAIQQGEVRRVGEGFSRKVDVRLVTATNRPLGDEVAAGRFRRDLLYRVDVIRIRVPPLRERPGDIPILAAHFWRLAAVRAGTRATLSAGVLTELTRYHWPGNVRELQNAVAVLAVSAPASGVVRPALLPPAVATPDAHPTGSLAEARAEFERRYVEIALTRAGGNRTQAAALLGLSRQGLIKVLARLAMP